MLFQRAFLFPTKAESCGNSLVAKGSKTVTLQLSGLPVWICSLMGGKKVTVAVSHGTEHWALKCMCSCETKPHLKPFLGVACRILCTSSVGVLEPDECRDLLDNLRSIYHEKQSASTPTEKEAKTTEKHLPTTAKQANNGSFTRETEALGWYMGRKLRIKLRHSSGARTPTEEVFRSRHRRPGSVSGEVSRLHMTEDHRRVVCLARLAPFPNKIVMPTIIRTRHTTVFGCRRTVFMCSINVCL